MGRPSPDRPSRLEEQIGRGLGKLVGRLRRTQLWQETCRAFEEGKSGQRSPTSPPKEGR